MERKFHQWLIDRQAAGRVHGCSPNQRTVSPFELKRGVGDDAAIGTFGTGPTEIVIATDAIAEGTHFILPAETTEGMSGDENVASGNDDSGNDVESGDELFRLIGRKALAVSLSDIAAMGGWPVAATLCFQCPKTAKFEHLQGAFVGAERLAAEFGFSIVGGDTNTWDSGWVISSTVIGTRPTGLAGWGLADAQPGDSIFVSGAFGGSIHGRHLSFEPRLRLADYLVENYSIHAATDATDSLTSDLFAIAAASGVQLQLDLSQVPISDDVGVDLSDRLAHALSDGEDFELIFTVPNDVAKILRQESLPTPVTEIGRVTHGKPGLVNTKGEPIVVKGYDH